MIVAAKYGIGKHVLIVAQDPENFVNIGKVKSEDLRSDLC